MPRRALVRCALVATVACGGGASSVAPSSVSLSGIWTLWSVNSSALPYTLPQSPNGYPTTIIGASLTIFGSDSGTYSEAIAARVVTPIRTIDTSLTYSGNWVLKGDSITFNDKVFSEAYEGSVAGNTIVKVVLFGYSGDYSR